MLGLEPIGDVVPHSQMREERVGLEHHVDGTLIGLRPDEVVAVELDPARRHLFEPTDTAQQRRLAASARPEQREELAIADLQAHVVQCAHLAEPLHDVVDSDHVAVRSGQLDVDGGRLVRDAHCRTSSIRVRDPRRPITSVAVTIESIVTDSRIVATALISGVMPNRIML